MVEESINTIPLFALNKYTNNARFGDSLSILPDSSLLVYKAYPDHPLGLHPGDIMLGYDGKSWKDLYKEILAARLPYHFVGSVGSTVSAGLNWHLFDTLDVIKFESGDTMHYSTLLLNELSEGSIANSDQISVPGVPFWVNEGKGTEPQKDYVSWGFIEDTHIGYIYLVILSNNFSINSKFSAAVKNIMDDPDTEGLITAAIPDKFSLEQNYPNPFNPTTMISYQLAMSSDVELSIYNMLGQKVATLVSKKQPAGNYDVEWDATGFASGVYLYKLETGQGYEKTKKLILIK